MKINKRNLLFIVIFYLALSLGVFVFYVVNPFDNECVQGNCWNGQGTYIYNSGMKYEGEWKYGRRHGKGTLTYPNLYKYEGEWRNNKKDGLGTIVYDKGSHYIARYTGEWKNGNMHGKGTITYQSGGQYIGEMKNGNKHGKGTIIYPNGRIFRGEWKNDRNLDISRWKRD